MEDKTVESQVHVNLILDQSQPVFYAQRGRFCHTETEYLSHHCM